jgi:hypothetical protein
MLEKELAEATAIAAGERQVESFASSFTDSEKRACDQARTVAARKRHKAANARLKREKMHYAKATPTTTRSRSFDEAGAGICGIPPKIAKAAYAAAERYR